jgi:hypothetical protein
MDDMWRSHPSVMACKAVGQSPRERGGGERERNQRGGGRRKSQEKGSEKREEGRETRLRRSSQKNKQPNSKETDKQNREIGRRREGDGDVPHGNGCSMACPPVASPDSRLRQTTQLLRGREEGRKGASHYGERSGDRIGSAVITRAEGLID